VPAGETWAPDRLSRGIGSLSYESAGMPA